MTGIKTLEGTIIAGNTYVTVVHTLTSTPTLKDITLQPQDDLGGRTCWPSDITSTNFRINISSMDLADHTITATIVYETVIAGSPTYCSHDDVKAYSKIVYTDLGYANDTAFNTFLDSLIVLAQGIIDNYCSVPSGFFAADGLSFTNQLYDYRYPWIDLRYYPVLSVSKVEYNDQGYGIAPNWVTLDSVDYIMNTDTGQLMLVNDVPAIPEQSVRVTYTAGYSAVPSLVQHVCLQICSSMLHEILQRKLAPVVRADDVSLKVLVPEAFNRELQVMLAPYVRKSVAVG